MARFLQDQNKVAWQHESGTYTFTSGNGFWPGQVTEHTIDDEEGKITSRFLGTANRNFDTVEQGPRDLTGTLTYHPTDMRMVFIAIGSVHEVIDSAGGSSVHFATQVETNVQANAFTSGVLNPPRSFTLEDSKQSPGTGRNFIRTVKGCIPNVMTLTATQGEKITVAIDYIAEDIEITSGATTAITEPTITPYLWSSASLTIAGSDIGTPKEIVLEINQNLEAPHYLNGSRQIGVPFPQNRENTLSVTVDWEGNDADFMYNALYKDNATFNTVFDLNQDTTGSQHTIFTLSGCRFMKPDIPSTNEGPTEVTFDIIAQSITGSAYDTGSSINPF